MLVMIPDIMNQFLKVRAGEIDLNWDLYVVPNRANLIPWINIQNRIGNFLDQLKADYLMPYSLFISFFYNL